MDTRFKVHSEASFALRGLTSGETKKHTGFSGYQPSLTRTLPYGHGFPSVASPHGNRSFHRSHILSESANVTVNRPLSPHLPVKKPQFSAAFSISHRIFGAGLTSFILLVPLAYKYSVLFDV